MNEVDRLKVEIEILKQLNKNLLAERDHWRDQVIAEKNKPRACRHGVIGDCIECDAESI
jgi:hypothetical protein